MADAPGDPRLFYTRHIFMCNNVRPDGHPRGCCMARAEAAGGFDKVRGYMREKARAAGVENIRFNAAGCLDRCEFGPNMVIYPEGTVVPLRNHRGCRRDHPEASGRGRPGRTADAAAGPAAAKALTAAEFTTDTIFAPATAAGRAAVAILRLSGPDTARGRLAGRGRFATAAIGPAQTVRQPGERRAARRRIGAVVPGAEQRHRRGCRRVPPARQPRRARCVHRGTEPARAAAR